MLLLPIPSPVAGIHRADTGTGTLAATLPPRQSDLLPEALPTGADGVTEAPFSNSRPNSYANDSATPVKFGMLERAWLPRVGKGEAKGAETGPKSAQKSK